MFAEADAELVVGDELESRQVRWVHIADVPDVAPLLKGRELLLISGLGLPKTADGQRRYIADLATAGVAGIVIELGKRVRQVPPVLVEEARERNVPLIALRRETAYVSITERVHSEIVNRQHEILMRVDGLGRDLSKLVLHGASLREIVETLAMFVSKPVVLEDPAHQIVVIAGAENGGALVREDWQLHSRSAHIEHDVGAVHQEADGRCAWMVIRIQDRVWGRLHILGDAGGVSSSDCLALDRAAAALGMTLLRERDTSYLGQYARSSLLIDVLEGDRVTEQDLKVRAADLGVHIQDRDLRVIVVHARIADFAEALLFEEEERARLQSEMLSLIQDVSRSVNVEHLSAQIGDRIIVLTAMPDDGQTRARLEAWADAFRASLLDRFVSMRFAIGISGEISPTQIPRGFYEAKQAAQIGLRTNGAKGAVYFEEIGVQQVLAQLDRGPDLASFVETQLAPLLEVEAHQRGDLVKTLGEYLDRGGNKKATAEALYIDRRTLYHRLEKAKVILGRDFDDPSHRLAVHFSLKGLEYLRARNGPDQPPAV